MYPYTLVNHMNELEKTDTNTEQHITNKWGFGPNLWCSAGMWVILFVFHPETTITIFLTSQAFIEMFKYQAKMWYREACLLSNCPRFRSMRGLCDRRNPTWHCISRRFWDCEPFRPMFWLIFICLLYNLMYGQIGRRQWKTYSWWTKCLRNF